MPEKNFTSGEGWWWALRTWLALALAWLAVWVWLARAPEPWTAGWVGWWTGDARGENSVRSARVHLEAGMEVAPAEGNPAFRAVPMGFAVLGHWQERRIPFTWAGWIRVSSSAGAWPTYLLMTRWTEAPGGEFFVGFSNGFPVAVLDTKTAGTVPQKVKLELQGADQVSLDRWMHLAFSTDGTLIRLLVNGVPVAERHWIGQHGEPLFLAPLYVGAWRENAPVMETRPHPLVVEQDDVVLYSRAVPPDELAALAARGRGAWVREVARPSVARNVWRIGWPVALGSLALLVALRVWPRLGYWLREAARELSRPACRPVRWALVCGGLISTVLTMELWRHALHADRSRFNEALVRLHQDTDTYWEKKVQFLAQARDWVAAQTNLSQRRWEEWLAANHFPHDHAGLIGIGYAEQVLPKQVAEHERRWSREHGFEYKVWPAAGPEREHVRELEGNPALPVVLYHAGLLPKEHWYTNDTILGQDLLYRRADDPRAWSQGRRVEVAAARNEVTPSALETIAPAAWRGEAVQGLRLFMPWTLRTKEAKGPSVPLEANGWRGVVFGSVDLRVPLRSVFGPNSIVGCRYQIGGMGGQLYDLVADTGLLVRETAERPDALLRERVRIPFYHQRLYVDVWTTPAFTATSFRRWAWIVGVCSSVLTLLSAALLLAQARARARQEQVLEALRAANSELLLTYREREAMSRDLHDGSIQNLYALGLHLQRVQQLLGTEPRRVPGELRNSLELLNQSIAELRQFILSAGVQSLECKTVPEALEAYASQLRRATSATVELTVGPEADALGPRHGVQVLNVVREAASNALRHARARHIRIRLAARAGSTDTGPRWLLEIADDGCGFDPKANGWHGHGLNNLTARARELGGESSVDSSPGGGTRVRVEFQCNTAPTPAVRA